MRFVICAIITSVFLGLVIVLSISEVFALHGSNPSKIPIPIKPNPTPISKSNSSIQPRILVTWGYSYLPCPIFYGCEVYVDSLKEIPYKTNQYQKSQLIPKKYDSITPFYILVANQAGVYSGTRVTTVSEFGATPAHDKINTWDFTAGKAGAFDRANSQKISIKSLPEAKVTISMSFTYNKYTPLK